MTSMRELLKGVVDTLRAEGWEVIARAGRHYGRLTVKDRHQSGPGIAFEAQREDGGGITLWFNRRVAVHTDDRHLASDVLRFVRVEDLAVWEFFSEGCPRRPDPKPPEPPKYVTTISLTPDAVDWMRWAAGRVNGPHVYVFDTETGKRVDPAELEAQAAAERARVRAAVQSMSAEERAELRKLLGG